MEIGESRFRNHVVLQPVGRIDNVTSGQFQATLTAALARAEADVIIDFAAVDYIASAGLRALITARRNNPRDWRIGIAAPNTLVREVFTISRFSEVIPLYVSLEAAAATFSGTAQPRPAAREDGAAAPLIPVRFWGTRGSLPAPVGHRAVRAKIREALLAARDRNLATPEAIDAFIDCELPFSVHGTFGGNTSCVEIGSGGGEYVICDLGSGLRELGNRVLAEHGPARPQVFNVFLSHVHWDHIMGFPFFAPAYIPGNTIRLHGCHKTLREAMLRQQSAPCFPVPFEALGATIEFIQLEPGVEYQIAGFTVSAIEQFHEGGSYGYRFACRGKTIVYSTDCEHKTSVLDASYPFVRFFHNADLLIFDAMYSLADAVSVKEDWGHSSNIVAVELAQLAQVKRLALYHHEPAHDDARIERVLGETIRYEEISRDGHKVEVISAYDGLELSV